MKENENENKELKELKVLIEKVNTKLEKQTKLGYLIRRSIIGGIFGTFGATLIFGAILVLLAYFIKGAEQIPILNDLIERTKLEQLIDNYNDVEVHGDIEIDSSPQDSSSQDSQTEEPPN